MTQLIAKQIAAGFSRPGFATALPGSSTRGRYRSSGEDAAGEFSICLMSGSIFRIVAAS